MLGTVLQFLDGRSRHGQQDDVEAHRRIDFLPNAEPYVRASFDAGDASLSQTGFPAQLRLAESEAAAQTFEAVVGREFEPFGGQRRRGVEKLLKKVGTVFLAQLQPGRLCGMM